MDERLPENIAILGKPYVPDQIGVVLEVEAQPATATEIPIAPANRRGRGRPKGSKNRWLRRDFTRVTEAQQSIIKAAGFNKRNANFAAVCRDIAESNFTRFLELLTTDELPVRLAAWKELFNRGYGQAPKLVTVAADESPEGILRALAKEIKLLDAPQPIDVTAEARVTSTDNDAT